MRSDKGKKRKKYDNSTRELMAKMRHLQRQARKKQKVQPGEGTPLKERRRLRRNSMLPSPRVCPECGEIKPRSRQWVVKNNKAVCLVCYRKSK